MSRERLWEFLRFGLVGVANTAVYYVVYLLLLLVLPYLAAHVLAWTVAVYFSFFLNAAFTYRVRPTWRKALLFPLSNIPNIVMTTVGVTVLVEVVHLDEHIAPLVAGLIAMPFTYLFARAILVRRSDTAGAARRQGDGVLPVAQESSQ